MKPEYIIIHHSLTKDSNTVSWSAIREYHIKVKHWRDIGYHAGIELINGEYIILAGRPITAPGAHCLEKEMNSKSLGFCFVGNFDNETPCGEMLVKAAAYIKGWMEAFSIPTGRVQPHHLYAPYKTCPGKMFRIDLLWGLLG